MPSIGKEASIPEEMSCFYQSLNMLSTDVYCLSFIVYMFVCLDWSFYVDVLSLCYIIRPPLTHPFWVAFASRIHFLLPFITLFPAHRWQERGIPEERYVCGVARHENSCCMHVSWSSCSSDIELDRYLPISRNRRTWVPFSIGSVDLLGTQSSCALGSALGTDWSSRSGQSVNCFSNWTSRFTFLMMPCVSIPRPSVKYE